MEERAAPWVIGGVLVALKLVVTAVIIWNAPRDAHAAIWLFLIFHWPFIVGGLILAAAPIAFWVRLWRVRAKRAQLQAQEWEDHPSTLISRPRT